MSTPQKKQTKQEIDVVPDLQDRILTIRGERVILDSDLAEIYGAEVRTLNQQVKRNPDRFPEDFSFTLSKIEWEAVTALRSQNVILKRGQHRKHPPRVFTEHGALMAANVLNSKRAMEMSVFVVRAFTKMRAALSDTRELARKLATLECEVKSRLDSHDAAIVEVMQRILDLIDPPEHPAPPPPPRKIGFSVKESPAKYAARRRTRSKR
ncbi:MAG TPA: ORF6N domain-containing protein [Kiritimatiellia bacterium]|nr:ORF6N domain-containing protein [Kiritimatiellia bacterium]